MGQGSTNLVYTILGFQTIIVIGFHHNCWWSSYHTPKLGAQLVRPTQPRLAQSISPRVFATMSHGKYTSDLKDLRDKIISEYKHLEFKTPQGVKHLWSLYLGGKPSRDHCPSDILLEHVRPLEYAPRIPQEDVAMHSWDYVQIFTD
jgi:hypothetical protein